MPAADHGAFAVLQYLTAALGAMPVGNLFLTLSQPQKGVITATRMPCVEYHKRESLQLRVCPAWSARYRVLVD
jgi:hypothetical protein